MISIRRVSYDARMHDGMEPDPRERDPWQPHPGPGTAPSDAQARYALGLDPPAQQGARFAPGSYRYEGVYGAGAASMNPTQAIVRRIIAWAVIVACTGALFAMQAWSMHEMKSMIQDNHKELVASLEQAETQWAKRRIELEKRREQRLAATIKKIEARTEEIKPERERLAKEREERIKEAEKVLAAARAKIDDKIKEMKVDPKWPEWFPLAASPTSASTKAVLTPQADRSIVASANMDKGIYTVTVNTSLKNITGFRLEALSDPKLPANGPGLGDNGNFVLTEFEVFAAPAGSPDKQQKVNIAKGKADFTQGGFNINQTFNGQTRNQQGWAVAAPSYVLAPEARIADITTMIAAAITAAAAKVEGPIHIAGHSAGGHLVSRMACADAPLPAEVSGRIARVLSISGLHDLRPLMKTAMNADLQLDAAEAAAESAALRPPREGSHVIAWVGADERPEFVRQTELLATAWSGKAKVDTVIEPNRHHFDVIEALAEPDSAITRAFVGEI